MLKGNVVVKGIGGFLLNQNDKTDNNQIKNTDNLQEFVDFFNVYTLRANAHFHFSYFMESLQEGIQNDGKNKLLALIDKYAIESDNTQFTRTIEPETILYRARLVNDNDIYKRNGISVITDDNGRKIVTGFDEGNSREAPLGLSSGGRNNIRGASYLYLADTIETACSEVKPNIGQLISVAKFKVIKPIRILDFASDKKFETKESKDENCALGEMFTLIMRRYFEPVHDEKEYLATQVITDHIRKTGLDGVAYKSFYSKDGVNYTIFNSDRRKFDFLESKIIVLQNVEWGYYDINEMKTIKAQSLFPEKAIEKDVQEIVKRIEQKTNNNL